MPEGQPNKQTPQEDSDLQTLGMLVETSLAVEKLRVAFQTRITHLNIKGKHNSEAEGLYQQFTQLENQLDKKISAMIRTHPAFPWFKHIKGIGDENIAKVVSQIDIRRAETISNLWMFAGLAPDESGRSMKKTKGEASRYNSHLRTMCWRLGTALKRSKGKFYEYYIKEKEKYTQRFENQGYKILPAPRSRWICLNCGKSSTLKQDAPDCCQRPNLAKRSGKEPDGVIWLGHLDMMALRKMIKLFLSCLWLVWREGEGLPVSKPYVDKLKQSITYISPWDMNDSNPTS